jgi:hypothetical protein
MSRKTIIPARAAGLFLLFVNYNRVRFRCQRAQAYARIDRPASSHNRGPTPDAFFVIGQRDIPYHSIEAD